MGFGAIQAAKDLGYRVPQDISVIGMSGHPLGVFYGLSTIEQRPSEQGLRGANMIVDIVESDDPRQLLNFEQVNQWPIQLVVRSSTAKRSS